jgi:RibD C-terminal domain
LKSVGPNATLVQNDVGTVLRELKARLVGEIDVAGPDLARSLTDLGLVDEYRLYFRPFVLGHGTPLRRPPAAAPPCGQRPDSRGHDQIDVSSRLIAQLARRRARFSSKAFISDRFFTPGLPICPARKIFSTNTFRITEYRISFLFRRKEAHVRPIRQTRPLRSGGRKRAQRIFARLIGGQSIRAIAAAERLSVRRVQQIVRQELERRDANPADDYALLQIARLERALDLLGSQIDAGKPAAVHAFVRILDHLNRLAPERLRLRATAFRIGDEADKMAERFERLDAAREALALKDAEGGPAKAREQGAIKPRRSR